MNLRAALMTGLYLASGVAAAQESGNIAAEQKDIGQVHARIQAYSQALGVISELARSSSATIECNGICYFSNATKAITWTCAPKRVCNLRCTVNPPVGGCDDPGK